MFRGRGRRELTATSIRPRSSCTVPNAALLEGTREWKARVLYQIRVVEIPARDSAVVTFLANSSSFAVTHSARSVSSVSGT